MTTCEEVRLALGAHALGALDPQEAEEIDLHLATCEECGGELEELAGVAGFLGKVSERDVELVASPPRRVLERLLTDRARRRRRGRALMAVASAAAVVVVGGVVWSAMPGESPTAASAPAAEQASQFSAGEGDAARSELAEESGGTEDNSAEAQDSEKLTTRQESSPAPSDSRAPAPLRSPLGRAFSGADAGYRATVTAAPDGRRTDLMVQVEGIPPGTECRLVVVAADGSRERTEPWQVTREMYEDNAVFRHETRTVMADIAAFEITDAGGEVLVRIPVAGK